MNRPFVPIEEPVRRDPAAASGVPGFALWQLGFRPFYLLASVQAAFSIALWALQFTGMLASASLRGPAWHAHEMLFGFALAVIVGFLFTAGQTWCGQRTPHGGWLAALAALWLAARVLVLTPFGAAAAAANVAFPLAAAVGLAVPFIRARHRRNAFFVILLVGLAGTALVFHLVQLGIVAWTHASILPVGLDLVLFAMAVMGGRVIPMFTNNGVPGAGAIRTPWLERAALGSVLLVLALDALGIDGAPLALACAAAAILHALRLAGWRPWRTLRVPLVWVLHAGYAWIPVHFALRAGAELGADAPSIAWHALTAGAIGTLTLGMMTRTALGHTGRPLRAGRAEISSYVLVSAAALLRVLGPLVAPAHTIHAIAASAVCWSTAFAVYAAAYAPRLVRARVDGRPG
ncbi:MAG TPA: NnrS family protein [Caldimonas sp.]|nr:NnrS family protein [Caldimonas sp.]